MTFNKATLLKYSNRLLTGWAKSGTQAGTLHLVSNSDEMTLKAMLYSSFLVCVFVAAPYTRKGLKEWGL